ncbi:hypothetical protein COO60DRAFT_1552575 [Scenedesmus sp. NREL 46B-D3]|nr:hypothetical protein COO60DRAFT_1552575 [Scenedesmus sp. NREL 46B-D3]
MQRSSRKPANIADQLLADSQPLDAEEQAAVIAAVEEQHLQQNRAFKLTFACISSALAAFFLHAALQQQLHPFETRFTGELRPVTSSGTVAAILLLQGFGLLAAAAGLVKELPKKGDRERACMPAGVQVQMLLGNAVALASVGCFYWSAALWASVQKYGWDVGAKWELLWLPLLPLGVCLLCCYVVHSIHVTARDVQRLRQLQYDYKKV